jgi:signal transduction histidine kinase
MWVVKWALFLLAFWLFSPLEAVMHPQRNALFPTKTEIQAITALQLYDSLKRGNLELNQYNENSHHHWLIYEIPAFDIQTTKILEIPDYQINYLKIFAFEKDSKKPHKILQFGDEMPIEQWTHRNRNCHTFFKFKAKTPYTFVVYYSRPGNRPQFLINLHDPAVYTEYWYTIEQKFGFIYGLILVYLILIVILTVYSRNRQYFFLGLWIFVYFSYFFMSSGHLKYYFSVDLEGVYSTIRVSLAFLGLYAMNAFSLLHYEQEKRLRYIKIFWDFWLVVMLFISCYNFITGQNIHEGFEKELILLVRILVLVLLIIQVYLPYQHYQKTAKVTYLTFVILFSGLNFFVYIYQTVVLEELDFNRYVFGTIWFLFFEILVIALGIAIYTVQEQKRRIYLNLTHAQLQKEARAIGFEVREKERQRIASELHDDILNRLSMSLSMFRDRVISSRDYSEILRRISEDIKHYALGIYPVWVDQVNIYELLNENIRPWALASGLDFSFDCEPKNQAYSTAVKLHVFRLLQEFVKNAITHGKASNVHVSIRQQNGTLQIDLRDDGIGYNVNDTFPGLGTQSAKNRVQILGGELKISSRLGSGVEWHIGLPQN